MCLAYSLGTFRKSQKVSDLNFDPQWVKMNREHNMGYYAPPLPKHKRVKKAVNCSFRKFVFCFLEYLLLLTIGQNWVMFC